MSILSNQPRTLCGKSNLHFSEILSRLERVQGPDAQGNYKALCPFHDDHNPSFSVCADKGFRCFGCEEKGSIESLIYKLGLEQKQPEQLQIAKNLRKREADEPKFDWKKAKIHSYVDEDGMELFQVGRIGTGQTKQIRQRRQESGKWVFNLKGVRRVLYQLPSVLRAKTILICEGEKAADAVNHRLKQIRKFGDLVATTNPLGAGKWMDSFSTVFQEKKVVIFADNDDIGRQHALAVATSVFPYISELKVIELPGLPPKGDVADFLEDEAATNHLLEIINNASLWEPADNSLNSFFSCPQQKFDLELDCPAFYGLAGDIIRIISPHCESAAVALLSTFLVAYGNLIGPAPHWKAGRTRHGLNLFVALVGKSARARKGSSWSPIEEIFTKIDPAWVTLSGLSSGEGLIHRLRDPAPTDFVNLSNGSICQETNHSDKRCMVYEPEFAQVLQCIDRKGNTLSSTLRNAWDGRSLETVTKNGPAKASHTHISMMAHITEHELKKLLSSSDTVNGFANRIIWLQVERSKLLPGGGEDYEEQMKLLYERLKAAVNFAKSAKELTLYPPILPLWDDVYRFLAKEEMGILDAVTSRAEAQVRRIACLYALLDLSLIVRKQHILAALALWKYSAHSAAQIFGDVTGNLEADRILESLTSAGPDGLTQTEISKIFGNNIAAKKVHTALQLLLDFNKVRMESSSQQKGRKITRWFASQPVTIEEVIQKHELNELNEICPNRVDSPDVEEIIL